MTRECLSAILRSCIYWQSWAKQWGILCYTVCNTIVGIVETTTPQLTITEHPWEVHHRKACCWVCSKLRLLEIWDLIYTWHLMSYYQMTGECLAGIHGSCILTKWNPAITDILCLHHICNTTGGLRRQMLFYWLHFLRLQRRLMVTSPG